MNRWFVVLSALLLSAPALAHRSLLLTAEDAPVEPMTRGQLELEVQRLEATKPSLGAPIALTAVGGGLLLGGGGVALGGLADLIILGTRGTYALVGYIFLGFGAALAVTGGVLLAVGLVKLFHRLGERGVISQRIDEVNARLEALERQSPPPDAGFFRLQPDVVLATF